MCSKEKSCHAINNRSLRTIPANRADCANLNKQLEIYLGGGDGAEEKAKHIVKN